MTIFRPCIDLHQGKVKQIVGETLNSAESDVVENFVSEYRPSYYAEKFQKDSLTGGHVIMLGPGNEQAALDALQAYPNGLQIGGGITNENAAQYLEAGATHVIVTSFIFQNGTLNEKNLQKIVSEIGKQHLVIDLSCKKHENRWHVATNQWSTISDFEVNSGNIRDLQAYCDEFLIHAVDVEGKRSGVQEALVEDLSQWVTIPTTYAGGVRTVEDLDRFKELCKGSLDITIGSALDLFGGSLSYEEVVRYFSQ